MVILNILMDPLMVPMMAFLWINNRKLYLASLMVLIKANLMDPLITLGTSHTYGKRLLNQYKTTHYQILQHKRNLL